MTSLCSPAPSRQDAPLAVPTPADTATGDYLAFLADGGDPADYAPGWSDPSPLDFALYLGHELGADGIDADPLTDDPAERDAFERGHNAGDDQLWRVDPLWAAHLLERRRAVGRAS